MYMPRRNASSDHMLTLFCYDVKESLNHFNRFFKTNCSKESIRGNDMHYCL